MTHLPRHPKQAKLDRGSVSNGHYVTTAKGGSRESRQQNAFPDRAPLSDRGRSPRISLHVGGVL